MKECANLQAGERLGDYTIVRLLGKGGMGAVYLVHNKNGAQFAAKVVLLPDDDARREWRRRFVREAGFAMTVHHKNLVAVHDTGEVEATGLCYIIMDYMPGGTLSDLLKRKGRLGVREAVDIAIAIASVLEVAHGVGAVHRDIKPDNILFDADGTPKLTDMGIAKFGDANSSTTVTSTGKIIGTPAYMSPEQMMDSHSVDARADIYSLGLVLYEMLTGKRPHANSTVVELIAKALKGEELPDIRTIRPEVSVALSYVLSLMVAVKPEERIASAMEAAKMLYDAATDRLVMKHRPSRPSATAGNVLVQGARKGLKSVLIWGIGGLMLVAAIAVGGWWMNNSKNPVEQQVPHQDILPKMSGGDVKSNGGSEISARPSKSSDIEEVNTSKNSERLLRMKESLERRGFDVVFDHYVGEPASWKANCVALEYDKDYRTITVQAKVFSPEQQAKILEYLKSENHWLVIDPSDKGAFDNEKQIKCDTQVVVAKPIVRISVAYMVISESDLNKIGDFQTISDDAPLRCKDTFGILRDLVHSNGTSKVIGASLDVVTRFLAKNGISLISDTGHMLMESWGKDGAKFKSGGTRFVKVSGSNVGGIPYGFTINAKGGMVDDSTMSLDFNYELSAITSANDETYDLKSETANMKIDCPIGRTTLVRGFMDMVDKKTPPSRLPFLRSIPILNRFVADSGKEVSDSRLVIMICPEIVDSAQTVKPDVGKKNHIGGPGQVSQIHYQGAKNRKDEKESSGKECGMNIRYKDDVKEKHVANLADFDIKDGVVYGTKLRGVDEIVVPSGVRSVCIDGLVHSGAKTIIIPEGVKHIGRTSGNYDPDVMLEEVRLPASVSSLDSAAFDGRWHRLRKIEVAPGAPYVVRRGCLIDIRNGTLVFAMPSNGKIVVPDSIKVIRSSSFHCNFVNEVVIPTGVEKIEKAAFYGCYGLKKISLPATVTEISRGAFPMCGKLDRIDIAPGNARYATKDGMLIDMKTGTVLRAFGQPKKVVIPKEVKIIGEGAFSSLESLLSVTVPDTVSQIEDGAFAHCYNMVELRLPARVDHCGNHFITGCRSLASVKIPMGMTELVGNNSIEGCRKLRKLELPKGLRYIGAGGLGAICACDSLERISIPASVSHISSGSGFIENPSLREFCVDPANREFCSDSGVLFSKAKTRLIRCPDAKKGAYTIPGSVLTIDACAFNGCKYLTEIRIPDGVKEIGNEAFKDCPASITRYHLTEIEKMNKAKDSERLPRMKDSSQQPTGSRNYIGTIIRDGVDFDTVSWLSDVSYPDSRGNVVGDGSKLTLNVCSNATITVTKRLVVDTLALSGDGDLTLRIAADGTLYPGAIDTSEYVGTLRFVVGDGARLCYDLGGAHNSYAYNGDYLPFERYDMEVERGGVVAFTYSMTKECAGAMNRNFSRLSGAGTISFDTVYSGDGNWLLFPLSKFAETLTLNNESDIVLEPTFSDDNPLVIHNLSGNGRFRCDWASYVMRRLRTIQTKNSTFTGRFMSNTNGNNMRECNLDVLSDGSAPDYESKRLVLSGKDGISTATDGRFYFRDAKGTLTVEPTGALEINYMWGGPAEIYGAVGGRGGFSSNVVFHSGCELFCSTNSYLTATGSVSFPTNMVVRMDFESDGQIVLEIKNATGVPDLSKTKLNVYINGVPNERYRLHAREGSDHRLVILVCPENVDINQSTKPSVGKEIHVGVPDKEIKGQVPISNDDGMKLPVGSMPKVGLMVAYDYDGGAAVNSGYGTAAVLREDVSYKDGAAVFDGNYQFSKGEDVVIPEFNYDRFSVALSFKPNKEWFLKNDPNEMLRIGTCASGMLEMTPSKWNGDHVRISFSDSRVEQISLPIEIGKWNWVVLSIDVKRRLAMVAVNGKPPVERILPKDFYWKIPYDEIEGDHYRRIHFGNANRGIRYCGAIDDLMVYDRALTQRELQDIVSGAPYGGNATVSASPGISPLGFQKAKLIDGKWVLSRQPEMSQYWNGIISMGEITLGVREDKDGLVVPPIGQLSHETIDLSMPVVDAEGKELAIYAIGSSEGAVYCAGRSSTKTIKLPLSLRELRNLAIAGCLQLRVISLPKALEKIGDSAFYSCNRLESVVIPENVRQIGARAFESCGCLTKVEILSKSVAIAKNAFARSTPVGSVMPKEDWTTGPVTKEVKGDSAFAYAKQGRMKEPLFSFGYGDICFGRPHGDIGGWGHTPMMGQRSLGVFDIHFLKVGPGLLAGIELTWRKKCELEGNADDAVETASKLVSILSGKLKGNVKMPEILPKSEWPEFGDMGNYYAMYAQIQPIGTSESEVNGYKIKVSVYCGRKDKNVAVVINVVDSYMFKAWGVPVPVE